MEFEFDLGKFKRNVKSFKEEQRPIFSPLGITCQVADCPNHTHFRRYGQLLDHWIDVHKEKRKLSKCTSCKKCFKTKASARNHVIAGHRKNNVDGLLVDIVVNNRSYISPGNTPLPRKMSQMKERTRKIEKKEKKKTTVGGMRRYPIFDEKRITRTNSTVNRDEVMIVDENSNAQRLRVSLKKK